MRDWGQDYPMEVKTTKEQLLKGPFSLNIIIIWVSYVSSNNWIT